MVTSRKSMIRNAESKFNPVVASPNIKLKLFDTADIEKSLRDLRIKTSAWKSGNISRNRYIVLFHMTVALDAAFLLMIEINVFIQPLVTTFLRLLASKGCKKIKTGDSVIFQHDSRFCPVGFLELVYNSCKVKAMVPSGHKFWKWSVREDILLYQKKGIVIVIPPTEIILNCKIFTVKELELVSGNWIFLKT